ncbi:FKBP-type peptidyl-prolyl cis-trans isomerase [Cellulomonas sp. URHE0023]|uniref:FKBP-type peptidyl-prolyl cis-trans isomerase n=1 Tax=Cellulomonas sp. URHE0023 TaxID=1380354 RepID=UPI00068CBD52|nr:FKBP-type peptidyl-prolyl cis-trans isomerase [Cellulomonas sp. URHE0023]
MRRPTIARRGIAATALALTLGLTLAACSGDSEDDASPTPSATSTADPAAEADEAAVAAITVTGDPGAEPVVTLPTTPFEVSTTVVKVLTPGTGETIEDGQQLTIQSVVVSGVDGSVAASTYTTTPDIVILDADLGDLHDTLVGEKVGARFVRTVPPQSADDPTSYVQVGEIVAATTIPSRASGTPVTPPAGLPTVTLDSDGKPTVAAATGAAPTTLVVQPLITGTGAPVTAEQTLTVNYDLSLWDGTAVTSTWDDGKPAQFALSSTIPGWQEGLVGQPVGSQVLLVVPPDKGYGAKASDTIPANSTLVYVVDILAAS